MTASIKERIKLNKVLTTSQKTGGLIGVNPEKPNKISGFDKLEIDPSQIPTIVSGRENKSSYLQNRVDKYRSHLMTARNSNQYTTNSAFNITYRTVKINENLALKNIEGWKERGGSLSIGHQTAAGLSSTQSGLGSHHESSTIKFRNLKGSQEQQKAMDAVIDVKHVETFNKYFNKREKDRSSIEQQRDGPNSK